MLYSMRTTRLKLAPSAGEKSRAPIHREAPTFVEQSTGQEILATGIKVDHCIYSLP